jgi:putative Mn2+ efflux pump MntP
MIAGVVKFLPVGNDHTMQYLTSFFVALGLAMDAFAVSLGVGTCQKAGDSRSQFRLFFHFGVFQMGMTILGWMAGNTISKFIQDYDHWIAFALLLYVGINMIRSGVNEANESYPSNPSKGRLLVILCVATSLDALAVGISMAMLGTPVMLPAIIIGVVTSMLSAIGLRVGDNIGKSFGKRVEIFGGLLLIGIGIKILVEHLAN